MDSGKHAVYSSRMYANKSYTTFKWCLEDYSILKNYYAGRVMSPPFKIFQTEKECILEFQHLQSYAHVIVYFPIDIDLHTLKVDVSIVDECNRKIVTKSSIATYPLIPDAANSKDKVFHNNLIPASDLLTKKEYLSNDTLTILCEITIIESVNKSSIDTATQVRCLDNNVREKFEEFYRDECFSDVTLSVGDTKFRAHKVILAASSPVYEAMFKTSMTEQTNNEVIINDVKPADFKAFLKSVYSGSIASVEEHVGLILVVADKYQVTTIKNVCEKYIIDHLDSANALEYLLLAHSHGFENLKKPAVAVAIHFHKDLSSLPDFQTLCEYPELVSEIFQKMSG